MTDYYEHLPLALRPVTLSRLAPAVRKLAEDEWEDASVQTELVNLANDIDSRLERIGRGDLQV